MGLQKNSHKNTTSSKPNRVVIIGCDNVSGPSAYSLGMSSAVDELVLIGDGESHLLAEIVELNSAFPLEHPFRIWAGEYKDLKEADIAIVAVGCERRFHDTAEHHLARTAKLVRAAGERLRATGFVGIVLVTTNPVDEMTKVAQEASGLPVERVIGMGSNSPWLRPVNRNVTKQNLPITVWCSAHNSGGQFMDSCQPDCPYFEDILEEFSEKEASLPSSKASETNSLASCVMRVCEAILLNERTVLTVSAKTLGEYGIWGVYMTLPCVIGRSGVERIVEFKVSDQKRRRLLDYARELGNTNRILSSRSKPAFSVRKLAPVQKIPS